MFKKILTVIRSFITRNFKNLTEYELLIRGLTKSDDKVLDQLKEIKSFMDELSVEIYYSLGFAFTPDKKHVALITKFRPVYQNGLLNGIGGLVEQNETVVAGMVREFKEETGRDTVESDWKLVELYNPTGTLCYIFVYAYIIADPETVNTVTDEEVNWYLVDELKESTLVPETLRFIKSAIESLDKVNQ